MQAPDGRNPAIELYRVLLMFLIVFHHSFVHGCWSPYGEGRFLAPLVAYVLNAFVIWHVDGFLSITGWFGTRFSLARFSKLWGVIAIYSIASIIYGCLTNGKLSSSYLAGGWFGTTYLFFIFLTPFLNAALDFLARDRRKFYIAWIVLDCGVFLNWAPCHLLSFVSGCGAGGYSVVTFIVMYANVRMLKLSGIFDRISPKMIIGMTLVFIGMITALANFRMLIRILIRGSGWNWVDFVEGIGCGSAYNAPHVMLMAIAMLLLFSKFVKVPQWLSRIVIRISPLMFGVYIIHDTTTFGRQIYRIPQEWMAANFGWHPLAIIFTTAIGCFAVCIVIECVRRWTTAPFVRWVMPKVRLLDGKLGQC